ncbi:hypothetical protein ADUPG1_013415 [Aduncisulcus paluster]|uniref:Uncharacterized protein n=1 Tax=Aduncisulcus paluster TaxID=2918883 RepID=A0ABQ5K2U4_9EUKA|nr:hypothetical protein ADUPG1_013415 [Aduncisulcus paluster]|eukprot:gnl/Carplike_NY0171/1974_a2667_1130.p1 GENE.gnl/Carplike_NY0171/1974_a2667_1130~~gnl/Carplike_NY0171/1974_a2667_1130.p1  ORF type:complete len:283 (-),score=84.74 gnl/Carplike_NY0171/1974_a2667_1130:44-892(-)
MPSTPQKGLAQSPKSKAIAVYSVSPHRSPGYRASTSPRRSSSPRQLSPTQPKPFSFASRSRSPIKRKGDSVSLVSSKQETNEVLEQQLILANKVKKLLREEQLLKKQTEMAQKKLEQKRSRQLEKEAIQSRKDEEDAKKQAELDRIKKLHWRRTLEMRDAIKTAKASVVLVKKEEAKKEKDRIESLRRKRQAEQMRRDKECKELHERAKQEELHRKETIERHIEMKREQATTDMSYIVDNLTSMRKHAEVEKKKLTRMEQELADRVKLMKQQRDKLVDQIEK